MRWRAIVLCVCAVACGEPARRRGDASAPKSVASGAAPMASASAPTSPRAPFVVAIVVDQLAAWVATSRWPELPADGAFARLRREGVWVQNLRYAHAMTDTAPGHAALHTGRTPRENGIFANELPAAGDRRVSILRDAGSRLVTGASGEASAIRQDLPGSSASRLRVRTVADELRAERPDALVVSLSLKDRGAILPAGKAPTHVLWFDTALDQFVTSTAFASALPPFAALGSAGAVRQARGGPWEPRDVAWLRAHARTADDAPGEGDLEGFGVTFPHVARSGHAFRATPASDAVLFRLALAATEHAPRDQPTLLLLSLSANDVVGHVFGADSWEAWEYLRTLDLQLAAFLAALEQRHGRVSVMVSADHGTSSMPEARAVSRDGCDKACDGGARVHPVELAAELRERAVAALGPGSWVDGVAEPYVFLSKEARALSGKRREALDAAIRDELGRHRAIAETFDVRALEARCPGELARAAGPRTRAAAGEPLVVLVCRSWSNELGAGDYFVVPRPGSFFDAEITPGRGGGHGTPYLYDRTVPLLVREGQGRARGEVLERPVDFAAFAKIEAHLLALEPASVDEILAEHGARP